MFSNSVIFSMGLFEQLTMGEDIWNNILPNAFGEESDSFAIYTKYLIFQMDSLFTVGEDFRKVLIPF